jgi:hypothetical protein
MIDFDDNGGNLDVFAWLLYVTSGSIAIATGYSFALTRSQGCGYHPFGSIIFWLDGKPFTCEVGTGPFVPGRFRARVPS